MPAVNVNFKRGTHSALMALASTGYNEGTFYLTNDTNRLYFAQTNSKLVDLNQYIHLWDTTVESTNLPVASANLVLEKGDIYYLIQQNALIIYNGATANPVWTQLNPDTFLTSANNAVGVTGSNSDQTQTIGVSVSDSAGNTASGQFQLVAGSNVSFTKNGNAITIASTDTNDNTTYTLGTQTSVANSDIGKLVLTPSTGSAQTINIKGEGNTHVVSDASGNITISSAGGVDSISGQFSSTGAIQTQIQLFDGSTLTPASVLPHITYGENGSSTVEFVRDANDFTDGTATLSVYTIAQTDQKIADALAEADALTYKGTVSSSDAATKLVSTAKVGDTYKATGDISKSGLIHVDSNKNGTAKAGDLIIASGTDGNVVWEVIPSGDDQAIDVDLGTNDNTFTITDNNVSLGGFNLTGGTNITVNSSVSGTAKTFTIAHATPSSGTAVTVANAVNSNGNDNTTLHAASSTGTDLVIPVVTSISKDAQGHVTDVTAQNYVVVDTHGSISGMDSNVSVTDNVATVGIGVTFDQVRSSSTFKITVDQDSLQLSKTTINNVDTVKLELVWGTF